MTRIRRATWFATLRRERGAFAVLAAILLVLQSLQPFTGLASGVNAVICVGLPDGSKTVVSPGSDSHHENCAKCIAGACGPSAAAKALTNDVAAWVAPVAPILPSLTLLNKHAAMRRPPGAVGIRAPPAFV